MTVNGNNVEATGLFVEHYQKNRGRLERPERKVIFFQNEMPYDRQPGGLDERELQRVSAIAVASNVTSFGAWGSAATATSTSIRPSTRPWRSVAYRSGVAWHDLLTVSSQRRHDQPT